jgi:hypothetical protein
MRRLPHLAHFPTTAGLARRLFVRALSLFNYSVF